uniref:GTD-binding domain-containing protein n=1 Tax=Oryza brachyantha TaxID=4533 RepID=J3MRQ5_ORYBR
MAGVGEEGEVAALREALRQRAAAVEELRAELEEERQAASSGADEALAMILRLQAEKAAERMEAEQFRRVAEERILHDGDSLAFLKAVVFHQEMEIASLNRRLLASATLRSTTRASPEIISEEDDDDMASRHSAKARKECNCSDHTTIAELGEGIEQIKLNVQNLQTEFIKTKESAITNGDSQAQLLAKICAKLDMIQAQQQDVQVEKRPSAPVPPVRALSREGGSSSKGGGGHTQSELLLMNHFIEVSAAIFSAPIVRPLIKAAASMPFFRCFLILVLAVVLRKVLIN